MQPSFQLANFESALRAGASARRLFPSTHLLGCGGIHFFFAMGTAASAGTISGFPAQTAAFAAPNFARQAGAGLSAGMPDGPRAMNPSEQKTHPSAHEMNPVAHFQRFRGKKRPSRAKSPNPVTHAMNCAPKIMNPAEESRLPAPQKTHSAPRRTRPAAHGIKPFSLITPLFTHETAPLGRHQPLHRPNLYLRRPKRPLGLLS